MSSKITPFPSILHLILPSPSPSFAFFSRSFHRQLNMSDLWDKDTKSVLRDMIISYLDSKISPEKDMGTLNKKEGCIWAKDFYLVVKGITGMIWDHYLHLSWIGDILHWNPITKKWVEEQRTTEKILEHAAERKANLLIQFAARDAIIFLLMPAPKDFERAQAWSIIGSALSDYADKCALYSESEAVTYRRRAIAAFVMAWGVSADGDVAENAQKELQDAVKSYLRAKRGQGQTITESKSTSESQKRLGSRDGLRARHRKNRVTKGGGARRYKSGVVKRSVRH
ncbi:hypothetical protein CCM_06462 [Cordyceps militaris CM01]|uniref:Uncharacterized protein n=1 Tax=Cordyceps militaris (strain CM01) TaxID=983644 RepID=G3JMK6_CORMM|nr:uncharacterized protein CCM_06462 [Cordyceps militaris CM01]EGX90042.1 hypothetical protein CCM_06462 [Cordyceps militaris CM01]